MQPPRLHPYPSKPRTTLTQPIHPTHNHASPAGATGHPLFALLALGVLAWDALAVYYAWRHFVAGPRFKRVDMRGKVRGGGCVRLWGCGIWKETRADPAS